MWPEILPVSLCQLSRMSHELDVLPMNYVCISPVAIRNIFIDCSDMSTKCFGLKQISGENTFLRLDKFILAEIYDFGRIAIFERTEFVEMRQ